jgi:hypothetical protein
VGLLQSLYTLFTDPAKAVSDVAAMPLDYACQSRVEEATRKTKWWSKYGVLVGAGAVIGVLVINDMRKSSKG